MDVKNAAEEKKLDRFLVHVPEMDSKNLVAEMHLKRHNFSSNSHEEDQY